MLRFFRSAGPVFFCMTLLLGLRSAPVEAQISKNTRTTREVMTSCLGEKSTGKHGEKFIGQARVIRNPRFIWKSPKAKTAGAKARVRKKPRAIRFRSGPSPSVETLISNGIPSSRFDLVFVCDGYMLSERSKCRTQVLNMTQKMFAEITPFREYARFFNVHLVHPPASQSGISNDGPNPRVLETPLGMGFGCDTVVTRLLCGDTSKALQYASLAPEYDAVIGVGNSVTSGGSAYFGSAVFLSGGGGSTHNVLAHELAHLVGWLLDEYFESGLTPGVFNDTEDSLSSFPNMTTLTVAQMQQRQTKWYYWLNENDPRYNGRIGRFEGSRRGETRIFRPTADSMMRTLGKPLHLPGIESILQNVYDSLYLLDASTPSANLEDGSPRVFRGNEVIELNLPSVITTLPSAYRIEYTASWIDGDAVVLNEPRLNLATLNIPPGDHGLRFTVTPRSPFLRALPRRNQSSLLYFVSIPDQTQPVQIEFEQQPPVSLRVTAGDQISLTARATTSDGSRVAYQWFFGEAGSSETLLDGETGETLTLASTLSMNRRTLWVRATAGEASIFSQPTVLEVVEPPLNLTFSEHPASAEASVGGSAEFRVRLLTEAEPARISFQWYKNGTIIPAAGNPSALTDKLVLSDVKESDSGDYHCVVRDTFGTAVAASNVAILKVRRVVLPVYRCTNPLHPLDVDDNRMITAMDALQIINKLNLRLDGPLTASCSQKPFLDTDGNGIIERADAQLVIDYLNANPTPTYY